MTDTVTDAVKGEWHTVKDAAALLEVSERTIWRRVKAGRLSIDRSVSPHLVDVSDALTDMSEPVSEPVSDEESEPVMSVSELRAEVKRLSELLEEVRAERDYLRSAHAAALTTSQRLLEHIEEPVEEEESIGVLVRLGRWLSGGR